MAKKKSTKVVKGKNTYAAPPPRVSFSPADALSDCATQYAALIADPFVKEHHACIPTWPAMESQKATAWVVGNFTTGTSGFGFVQFAPENGAVSAGGTDACVWASQSTYTGNTLAQTGVGVASFQSNSAYTAHTNGVKARLVAAGIRAWYSGPIKDLGGDLVCLQQPDHESVNNNSLPNLMSYSESRRFTQSPGCRYGVTRVPANVSETNFEIDLKAAILLNPYMAIAVQATPGLTYSFEAYMHFEYIGAPVRGKTPTSADAAGLSAVVTVGGHPAASTAYASTSAEDDKSRVMNFLENAGHYALAAVSGVGQLVGAIGPPIISTAGRLLAYGASAADAYLEAPTRVASYRRAPPQLMGTGGSSTSGTSRAAAPLMIGWK